MTFIIISNYEKKHLKTLSSLIVKSVRAQNYSKPRTTPSKVYKTAILESISVLLEKIDIRDWDQSSLQVFLRRGPIMQCKKIKGILWFFRAFFLYSQLILIYPSLSKVKILARFQSKKDDYVKSIISLLLCN